MNFFGHAVVASAVDDDPAFVLGAMLPDLQRMCGGRPREAAGAVARGVGDHHSTDEAFHDADGFVALCRTARESLVGAGVRRAVALGAAHVGVELLLDGALSIETRTLAAFRAALGFRAIEWSEGEQAARFDVLCDALVRAPIPAAYADPDEVTDRLLRALARRPRLVPAPDEHEPIRRAMHELRPHVVAGAPALLAAAAGPHG